MFLLLLEYLYTDGVVVGIDHALLGLYILADRYQMNWLSRQRCLELVIEKGLSDENAIMYLLAEVDGL